MKELLYRNKEWLQKQFDIYKKISIVAKETGYPRTCITRYAKKYSLYQKKYTRKNKNNLSKNYFKNIDTENKAYWLGFIMADGCMYEYKGQNKFQFSIKLKHDDIGHLKKFKKCIKFDGKIYEGKNIRNNNVNEYCAIKIYDKTFCANLISCGIVKNKTGKEYIPDCVDEKYYLDFIRGFLDGDGTIHGEIKKGKTATVSLCSTNIYMLKQIQKYINNNLNIKMNINKYKKIYTLTSVKKYDVYILLKALYENKKMFLSRKRKRAVQIIKDYEKEYLK